MENIYKNCEERMQKSLDRLISDFGAIRAGRANPNVLDRINVDYYGTPTPINQLGSVSVPEPRTLMIQPWDKSVLKEVEKAINTSDIGINPQNDGECIRLNFPPLTEERRRDLVKDISKMGEEAKVAVRSVRRDAMDDLKAKKKEFSEDDVKNQEKRIQELTDKFCKKVDDVTSAKEKEIMDI